MSKIKDKVFLRHLLIIAALTAAVYFDALFNGFVHDDHNQIEQNHWIKDISNIPEIFTHGVWSFAGITANYYRPMMHMIYMAEYHAFGLNPAGFHLINIFIHLCNSILVYLLAAYFWAGHDGQGSNSGISFPFVSAMLFAVTPIHTEAVTWVAGLPELSFSFFYLLSFYLYITAVTKEQGRAVYALSLISYFIACLSKETALTLPLLIVCYEHCYRKSGEKAISYLRRYLAFVLVTLVYLAMRLNTLGSVSPKVFNEELGIRGYILNVPTLFKDYLWKLVLPVNLKAIHVFHPVSSIVNIEVIFSAALVLFFALSFIISVKRNKVVCIALSVIAIPLLPAFYISGIPESVFAERYLYLPFWGFAMLEAIPIVWLSKRGKAAGATAILVAILCLYSGQTIARNTVWRNDYIFWSEALLKSPDSAKVHCNLGRYYLIKGNLDKAFEEYSTALRLADIAEAHDGLGTCYLDKGDLDKAFKEYMAAIKLADYPPSHNNLGMYYFDRGDLEKAYEEYRTAIRLADIPEAHNNLGTYYLNKGDLDRAVEEYKTAIRMKPDLEHAHYSLSEAYAKKGLMKNAIEELGIALNFNASHTEAYDALGYFYMATGQSNKAYNGFKAMLKIDPTSPNSFYTYFYLGKILLDNGKTEQAINEFQAALRLAPNDADAHEGLGIAYLKKNMTEEAVEEFKAASRINPNDADLHYNLGIALLGRGLKKEALTEIMIASRLKPEDSRIRKKLDNLQGAR